MSALGAGVVHAGRDVGVERAGGRVVLVAPDMALSTIMQESGKHFDPNIAEAFFLKREEFKEIAADTEKHG